MSPGGLVSLPPDAPFAAEGSGPQGAGAGGAAVVGNTVVLAVVGDAVEASAVEDAADAPRVVEFGEQATSRSSAREMHPIPKTMKPVGQREPDAGHSGRIHANTGPTVRTDGFATMPDRVRARLKGWRRAYHPAVADPHIVVVEDDEGIGASLARTLTGQGYEVDW